MNKNEKIVFEELKKQGFTTPSIAAIMGVVGSESGFLKLKETGYQNTSNSRIRSIFNYKLGNYSDTQLNILKSDYNAFFDVVYGGKYGNYNVGDGSKYVGRGFNGITFKDVYRLVSNGTGIDFVKSPQLLEQPLYAAKALAYYFRNEKNIPTFEKAFQEAYRRNAGYGNSWEYYKNSTNPAHAEGTVSKRAKGLKYLNEINGKKKIIGIFILSGVLVILAIRYKDVILKTLKKIEKGNL